MAWILQGSPNRFDIDTYLTKYPFVYWSVPRHQAEFSAGDRVFLWRAGDTDGVVAIGRVRELPAPRRSVAHPEALANDLLVSEPADPSEVKVGVDIDNVRLTPAEGMLERKTLKNHANFCDARIIRIPQGTVFPLTRYESTVLEGLWNPGASSDQRNPGPRSASAAEGFRSPPVSCVGDPSPTFRH